MVVWLSFLVCTISGQSCHVTVPTEQPFMGMSACQVEAMKSLPAWTEAVGISRKFVAPSARSRSLRTKYDTDLNR